MMRSVRGMGFTFALVLATAVSLTACTSKTKEPANTLRVSTPAKIKGLDPIFADDLYGGDEVGRVYDTLFEYDYLKRPYVLVPSIAEAMPEVSSDGKTYTIKLKKGVLFQDDVSFKETNGKGREMTADDVLYSFKRLSDPKLSSPGWWVFDGKVIGLNDWHDEMAKAATSDYSKAVEGFKALDRYTVQIKLTQKNYQFLYFLAMSFTSVVPHEAVEHYGAEFINHPVGTGPYKLTEFNPSSRLIWDRNPTYRKDLYPSEGEAGDKEKGLLADAGKQLPLSDRVVVTIFEEQQPMWLNFISGKLDLSTIPKDNYTQAIGADKELLPELKSKGLTLNKAPSLDVTHSTFNMSDPVMGKNKLLRQALSLAYDMGPVIDLFYNGRAIPAQGPIPPGLAGYDPDYKNPYRQFNLQKAKDLLAKAGYPEGKGLAPIELAAMSDSTNRQMSEYLEKSFGAIGVKVTTNAYSWPQFQDAVKNKKGQMWEFAWQADYPDAENFLQLFYSKNASPGPNDSNYSNPEFDKLYEKSLTFPDSPARTAIYQQMVKIVVEDCPWIFGTNRLVFTLTQPWTRNFKYNEVDHGRFKYYAVNPALRK